MNRKGLLRANKTKKVISVKRAYYSVQNVVSIFDSNVVRVPDSAVTNVDCSVVSYEYRSKKGDPLYVFWSCGDTEARRDKERGRHAVPVYERPGDSFETRPTVFTVAGNPMKNPVWVDLFTGRVYELPAKDVQHVDGETFYINVPVYDSPCILTERAALNLLK